MLCSLPGRVFAAKLPALAFSCLRMERQRGLLLLLLGFPLRHDEQSHTPKYTLLQMVDQISVSLTMVVLNELLLQNMRYYKVCYSCHFQY